uniref:ubiquitinyl hydrolase 1 n=1 Tax=Ciona savignyi TaxID=51511 RepID=H2YLT5_CIOSA
NTKNPLGVGGRMAKAFYVVVRRLWDGSKQAFSPHEFKDVVGLKDSRFTDGMQHDAQEFMAFLLDMLHEDLNTATGPHTVEQPRKCEEESEEKMATDAWRSHVSRAGSFIVENFHGMLQSELECLKCKTKSIKFDPFLFLPVPLPKKVQPFTVIFFQSNPSPPIKITVPVLTDGPKAIEMLTQVARHTGTCINNLLSYEVSNCTIQRFFIPSSPLDCSSKTSTVHVQEVMSHEEIGEPVYQIICKQWKSVPDIRQQCVMCNRKPDDTFELKRCMNCLAVAYCNRNCQKDHWLKHRVVCRRRLQLVGQPFVMCITESSATYTNVKALAFEWSNKNTKFFLLVLNPIKKKTVTYESCANCVFYCMFTQFQNAQRTSVQSILLINPYFKLMVNLMRIWHSFNNCVYFFYTLISSKKFKSSKKRGEILKKKTCYFSIFNSSKKRGEILKKQLVIFQSFCLNFSGDIPLNFLKDLFISLVWQNKKSIAKSVTVSNKPLDFSQPSRCVDLMEKSSKHDLHKCLDLFIEPEVLSQDEAWYCPKCKKHMQAVKKMSLWDLPDVLIVQLKRFSFKNYLWRDKISMFIDMPVKNLDMSTYCNNPRKTKSMSYDLFAVINHHGGILGGHYTTDVRLPDIQDTTSSIVDWRTCDDSRVTKLNRKIVTEAAYVMFYLRRSS